MTAALAAYLAELHDAGDADGILVTVRRSKTTQAGETSRWRCGHGRDGRHVLETSAEGRRLNGTGRPVGNTYPTGLSFTVG